MAAVPVSSAPIPRTSKPALEIFRFAVDDWSFGYGLYLNEKEHKVLGLCWESQTLTLRGPLRSRTKIERIELAINPRDFKPEDVKPNKS